VKKKIFLPITVSLIILVIWGCSDNKFKPTRSQPTDIPYYNPSNDTCFVCHNVSTLNKTIGSSIIPLYVNRDKFAFSVHRAVRCLDCHTDIIFNKGHSEVPKEYGGWAGWGSGDTSLTTSYTTKASVSCANCHTDKSGFFSSQHYLIEDIKGSHEEIYNGIEIGKDYDKAQCGKCHLTCATCHFKSMMIRSVSSWVDTSGHSVGDDITDYWSQLLKGEEAPSFGDWAIDWTTNVKSHTFATGEELGSSNAICGVCHTGMYREYNQTGYYHPEGPASWDSLISQGVEKYPQYEEWRFLKGDVVVNTGVPYLDSLYSQVVNQPHNRYRCIDCHDMVHSLGSITCLDCHSDKVIPRPKPHQKVSCIACHDATMNVWKDPDSGDTVRVAAVKENKIINWHSHMIIKPDTENTDYCDSKCHNSETGRRIGAPFSHKHRGNIHGD